MLKLSSSAHSICHSIISWDRSSRDSQQRVACCSSSSASVRGEDDIRNVYGPHIIGLAEKNLHTQKAFARKSKLALIDPSEVLSIILAARLAAALSLR